MTIQQDLQAFAPNSLVELFELDATSAGGTILRFHNGTNSLRGNVVWNANTYSYFPIEASGFEFTGRGQLPRPTLRVANITGIISVLARTYQDLVGCKLTRRRTMAKYLDAVNFPTRRNLLTYSEQFDNAAWTKAAGVNLTGGYADPLGNLTATRVEIPAVSTGVYRLIYRPIEAGENYAISVWIRSDVACDLIIGPNGQGNPENNIASVVGVSTVWKRFEFNFSGFVDSGLYISVGSTYWNAIAGSVNLGGARAVYIWGAQLETGSVATDYQAIGASFSQNPSADPTAALPDDVYFVDRKATENKMLVEFELAAAFDVAGVQLPRRYVVQNVCPWAYRSGECGYAGGAFFNANDQPVGSLADDSCGKRLSSCKARFGAYAELPFGGFPAVGLVR